MCKLQTSLSCALLSCFREIRRCAACTNARSCKFTTLQPGQVRFAHQSPSPILAVLQYLWRQGFLFLIGFHLLSLLLSHLFSGQKVWRLFGLGLAFWAKNAAKLKLGHVIACYGMSVSWLNEVSIVRTVPKYVTAVTAKELLTVGHVPFSTCICSQDFGHVGAWVDVSRPKRDPSFWPDAALRHFVASKALFMHFSALRRSLH